VKMSPPLSRQRDSQVETKLVDSSSKENESTSEKSKSKLLLLSNSLLSPKPLENPPWRAQKRREAAGAAGTAAAVELSATVELSAGAATAVELSATTGGATVGSVESGTGASVAAGSVTVGSGTAAVPDAGAGAGAATQAAGAVVRLSNT